MKLVEPGIARVGVDCLAITDEKRNKRCFHADGGGLSGFDLLISLQGE